MVVPHLDSETLVASVRRRCNLPEARANLSDEDILAFANDELMETILPVVKSTHEEYFVWNEIVSLESNKSKYTIPERAIGNALRDLSFGDLQNNVYEMTRIGRDDRYTTQFPSTYTQPYRYYVENSHVVMVPDVTESPTGTLTFTYLLRPNQLVTSDRVAKIQSITSDSVAIASITVGSTTTIVTDENHNLSSEESIVISAVSGTGASLVNGTHTVTVVNDVTFTIAVDTTGQGPLTAGLVDNNTTKFTLNQLPTNIVDKIDILKTKSPHNTLGFDIDVKKIVYASRTLSIKDSDVPEGIQEGDTIATVYETDIPGIPTELHRYLVTMVCERVMEHLGDKFGLAAAAKKAKETEISSTKLIENRVSSAPLKVKNNSGFLNRKYRRTRRF